MSINLNILGELVSEQLELNSEVAQESLVEGLQPVNVTIDNVDVSMVPESLRSLFTFKSEFTVGPGRSFEAKSVCLAVFPVRLDAEGNLSKASPSIKEAHLGGTLSKYTTGGDWGTPATIMPDLFLEAEFHGDETGLVIPVPTLLREPYPAKSGNVNLSLSTANKTIDNYLQYHDAARALFADIAKEVAAELGVPAGEQFLVCFVGFPQYSKEFRNDDKPTYWRAAFNGAYLVGGRKIGNSRGVSASLAGLRVKSSLKVGGKSLSERLAAEVMKAKQGSGMASVPTTAPKRMPVAPPIAVSQPVTEPAPVAVTQTMPSASILARLEALDALNDCDDPYALVDDEVLDNVPEEDAVVPAVRRSNPFAK